MADFRDLTDLQLMILNALWKRGEGTIAEVHAEVSAKAKASRKTVGTLLARLERRGIVRHRLEGREGVYKATVTRRKVLLSRMGSLLGALFDGGGRPVGVAAVDQSEVRAGDVERILTLLKRAERDLKE